MEVLRPQLVRIGNRIYRKNPVAAREGTNPEDEEMEPDFDTAEACYDDEVCDVDFDIEEFSGGFRMRLDFPSTYFKYIIGKRGDTKRRLETETRTQIRIPRAGQEGEIVIQGHDKKGVISAKTRVEVLVESARQKQPFTHFLSIPIQSEEIWERFEEFKFQIMDDDARESAVDPSIFQTPQKLHMTIGTMVLLNDKEIQRAKDLLHQCFDDLLEPILQGSPLFIDIRGLEYMNDDPGAVDVLYAKVQPSPEADKLQMLVDRLVDKFVSANLMQRQYERVKLHITVINTLFRKDPSGASAPQQSNARGPSRDRESFSAISILQKFGDFDFGPYQVDSVELSQRYSTAQNGYYESASSLKL
ncbi:activating signal cointegrator 1 complex subunit 1-like [Littorina saxatilis]|uniref:K Homology domain-containing protein n=1 Tax=Littorina saxatilis TaxID=31220 RepID=A0AAN9FZZ8_9CAEN